MAYQYFTYLQFYTGIENNKISYPSNIKTEADTFTSENNFEKPKFNTKPKEVDKPINFKCDGRQHCSQMHSYEEAKFFLQNCPNVKMDGDLDGVPCERQFGRYE